MQETRTKEVTLNGIHLFHDGYKKLQKYKSSSILWYKTRISMKFITTSIGIPGRELSAAFYAYVQAEGQN